MLTRKVFPYAAILFIVLITSCYSTGKGKKYREVNLHSETPIQSQITIENQGKKDARFFMKLNNGFYRSENEIADEIKKMPEEYSGELLERKAWRYVIKNVKFSKPLSSENWQHSPVLMINSIGNGICDDLSSTLHILWRALGLQSRVWALEGHVVPEVFSNGKWHMYDPSHQTYYLNRKNEIAGVEELSKHPELITEPIGRVGVENGNAVTYALAHSEKMANTYSSVSNNAINSWYNFDFSLVDTFFRLPAGATIKFPVSRSNSEIQTCNSFSSSYSFLSVEVNGKETAEISAPLILYAIEGAGTISIDNKQFQINSEELQKYLNDFSMFHQHVTLVGKNTNATIFYLLNSRAISINHTNTLFWGGYNTEGLHAEIKKDETVSANTNFSINLDSLIKEKFIAYDKRRGQRLQQIATLFTINADEKNIAERIAFIVSMDNKMSNEEKKQVLLFANKRVNALLAKLPTGKKRERFFESLSNPYLLIVLLTYIEYCNEQDIVKMVL